MKKSKEFHFGAASVMREVPPGQTAVIKFNGAIDQVETEWGVKMKYPIILFSHPSYESLSKEGIETTWQSNCQAAWDLAKALEQGIKELSEAFKENNWKLTRTEEGTYFLDVIL
tara:strand:+ start:50 stop:391 length:342 start_codon:yes stop_codon:yes gene_type:complete